MELFKFIREMYGMAGIYPPMPNKNCPYNLRNLFVLLILMLMLVLLVTYLLFKANSINELGDSFYVSISVFLHLYFLIVVIH